MSKRVYRHFNDDDLSKAAESVGNGSMSYRKAETTYGVPRSSIQRKVKGLQQKPYGRPPVFTDREEKQLTECIALTADWGLPLTSFDVRYIAKKYLEKKGVSEPTFKNNMPGNKWVKSFLKRQSDLLKTRMSHNIKRARAAVTPEIIEKYFEELTITLDGVSANAILNYDETSMQDNPGNNKVMVRRQCKYPDRILDYTKSSFSVMFAGTASGVSLPPFIVYKSENMYHSWTEGGPSGTRYSRSKSGWFEGNIFEEWFETIALPHLKSIEGPKVVIGDNLASHLSLKVVELCIEHNIRLTYLPPNSTHLCQPLDLAYFSPLKAIWRRELLAWKMKHKGSVRKDQFPRLLKKVLDELDSRSVDNLKAGFKKSGICPLDKNKVLDSLPQVSQEATESSGQRWITSFEDFLQETRKKETNTVPRKKKIEVLLGKSLSNVDVVEQLKKNEGRKQTKRVNDEQTHKNKNKSRRLLKENESAEEIECYNIVETSSCTDEIDPLHLFEDVNTSTPKVNRKSGKKSDNECNMDPLTIDEVMSVVPSTSTHKPKKAKRKMQLSLDSHSSSDDISLHDDTSSGHQSFSLLFDKDIEQELDANITLQNLGGSFLDKSFEGEEDFLDRTSREILKSSANICKTTDGDPTNKGAKENDFVLIELIYDEGSKREADKLFVGKVMQISGTSYKITFMRNYNGSKTIYVFPNVEDIDTIHMNQIVRVLENPCANRGRYTFNID